MPKYSDDYIIEVLFNIKDLTYRVNDLLTLDKKISTEDLNELNKLYQKRENEIESLKEWYYSSEGRSFVNKNLDIWEQIIEPIVSLDKDNSDILNKRLNELSSELKILANKKSLLIYKK